MNEYKELIIMIIITGVVFAVGGFVVGSALRSPETNTVVVDKLDNLPMQHQHEQLEISEDSKTPKVEIEVTADSESGYNLVLSTQNYDFTPLKVNEDPVQNEGHAHLYVNNTKIARLYTEFFHIPASVMNTGVNTVRVTLNANDHSEWAKDGETIQATTEVVIDD